MAAKRTCFLLILAAASFSAVLTSTAYAGQEKGGYVWPSHYDFFIPYGSKDGGPVYAKPGHKGASATLTCMEATGILKLRGYKDITEVNCSGVIYRFSVTNLEDRFLIEIDSRTGKIVSANNFSPHPFPTHAQIPFRP